MLIASRVAPWIAISFGLSAAACGGSESASPGGGGDAGGADVVSGEGGAVTEGGGGGEDASEPWIAVPLSSCVGDIYTTPVTIGGSQVFNAIIDTGSTSFGVAAKACTNCDVTPEYTPGTSATDEKQTASSQYGSGSWSGEIYQDAITIGAEPPLPVKFASITSQMTFFQTAQCDSKVKSYQAILGLGPTAVAVKGTNGYFDDLVSAQHVPDVFATELCSTGGTLWFGGWDASAITAAPQYTPMAAGIDADYYAVTLSSITVAGTSVPVGSGQSGLGAVSFVDTGTSIFILAQTPFAAVTSAITASAGFTSVFGAGSTLLSNPGTCLASTKTAAEIDAALPALTLVFGSNPGISVQAAPSESYLMNMNNQWCSAITGPMGQEFPISAILGSPILRSNVVIFDRANSRVGFAPHAPCN
jgi:Eukaryotic aspartyl protease